MIPVLIFMVAEIALAKCTVQGTYHCGEIIFQKQIEAETTERKNVCRGEADLVTDRNKKRIVVALREGLPCPPSGTKLQGHLDYLCQDTNPWTKANSWFREAASQCKKSRKERLAEIKELISNIQIGKTMRSSMEEKFLEFKAYDDSTHTMWYYEHPNILVGVSYSYEPQEKGVLNKATVIATPVIKEGRPNKWRP
jgi:hypothetical protein